MKMKSHYILRHQLAPLLREERLKRKLLPAQIALVCDLSVDTINQIEAGGGVSIRQYRHLIKYYRKKIKVCLVD